MNRCDFYVLPSTAPEKREHFLYKLLEKVTALGHRVYIRAASEQQASILDNKLWDYSEQGFIPHSLIAEGLNSPVEIGYGDSLPEHRDVFLNFDLEIPEHALAFDRILEIVVQTPEILAATRENYKLYKNADYDIHMNDMRPKNAAG